MTVRVDTIEEVLPLRLPPLRFPTLNSKTISCGRQTSLVAAYILLWSLANYAFNTVRETWHPAAAISCPPAVQQRILRMGRGPLKLDLSASIADDPTLYVVAYPRVVTGLSTFSSKVAATFRAHCYSPDSLF